MEKKGIRLGVTLILGLVIMCRQVEESVGAIHKVGDSAGWTIIGNIDYRQWAASRTFHVADTVMFVYNAKFHNVIQVQKYGEYKSCNASAAIATYTTGKDSISITSPGHHFFICGIPGHCQAGQKVDINVLHLSTSSTGPSLTTLSSTPAVTAVPPAPSPSEAASLYL